MYLYLDDTMKLGLDCVAQVSPRRAIAYGWTMVPRGLEGELAVAAGMDAPCGIIHASFHPRPDVAVADPLAAVVNGFVLMFETPEAPEELVLSLSAGDAHLRADLQDGALERNLGKATAALRWRVALDLLEQSVRSAELGALLRHQARPFGAFADWLGAMPMVRGRATDFGRIAEAEALALASGEVLVMLRAVGPVPPTAEIRATALGWLRGAPGAPAEAVFLPLAESHGARLPAALAFYGRVDGAVLDRLQSIELVVHAEPEPGEEVWLRCQPSAASVPDLLDAACRGTAASLAVPVAASGASGLDLLREVIARREAAFRPLIAAAAGDTAARDTAERPRTALLLGADDPAAVRLFQVTADIVARHCDTLLVMGGHGDEIAQALAPEGRPQVLLGEAAAQALQAAAIRRGVLAVDAAHYAEAVIADRPEDAFALWLDGGDLSRALALHAVAGFEPGLADSLARLLRGRRAGRFPAVARGWSNRHAAEPANAHLSRLWSLGARIAAHA